MIFDLVKVFGVVSLAVGAYFIVRSLMFKPLASSVNFEKMSIGLFCVVVSVFCFFYTTKSRLEKTRDELRFEVIETLVKKIDIEEKLYNELAEKDVESYVGLVKHYDELYNSQIDALLKDIDVIENYLTRGDK